MKNRFVVSLFAIFIGFGLLTTQVSAQAKGVAAGLQPFVEQHALAGAVVLVADKDKVLA
jgi:hypothetical protein